MSIKSSIFPATARSQIRTSRAYLGISLSNRLTVSPERLLDVLRWMEQNISTFDVVIGDYFQRHNLEDLEGYRPDEALAMATADGRAHASRVRRALDELKFAAVSIRCATDICSQSSFAPQLRVMESAWTSNGHFAQLIDKGTDAFLQRFAPEKMTAEPSRHHSRLYQLEELAMFSLLAVDGYSTIVYGGAYLPVMKALVSGELDNIAPALRRVVLVGLYPEQGK